MTIHDATEQAYKRGYDDGLHTDNVNHPDHYTFGSIECIDVIKQLTHSIGGFAAYCTGTILKYIWRWPHKNGIEDLKKARWYLNALIEELEKNDKLSDLVSVRDDLRSLPDSNDSLPDNRER